MAESMEAKQWTSFSAQAWGRTPCSKCVRRPAVVQHTAQAGLCAMRVVRVCYRQDRHGLSMRASLNSPVT
jgi:hypothetical protein